MAEIHKIQLLVIEEDMEVSLDDDKHVEVVVQLYLQNHMI